MRFFILAEGVAAIVAAVSTYLLGYLDGRTDIRTAREKMIHELQDFE